MGFIVLVSSRQDTASQYGKGRNISVTRLRYTANHNTLNSWPIRAHFKSNQIKSLLLSHHHSTCALVSEILESMHQPVQRQFTNRQYILTDLYRRQCAECTYIYSVHTVYFLRHTYSYQYTLCTVCTHSTLCTHTVYTHNNMRKCSRFYIGRIRNVMGLRWMVSSGCR